MPCSYIEALESEMLINSNMKNKQLRKEVDTTTQLLCFLTRRLEKNNPSLYSTILEENEDLRAWITTHEALDKQRWYKHYQPLYPNFTEEEIAKAVKSGMLEEV